MELTVDAREAAVIAGLGDGAYTKESLVLGDARLRRDDAEILVERKTWPDLLASIRDGRFREQRARLLAWRAEDPVGRKVVYVLEGAVPDDDACRSAAHRLTLVYGFGVWKTVSPVETAAHLLWMKEHHANLLRRSEPDADRIDDLQKSMVPRKRDIQTPKNLLIALLASIHGVSRASAAVLAGDYPSVSAFVSGWRERGEAVMAGLDAPAGGRKKKIGPAIASSVFGALGMAQS
jgi:ERCC4-type nuclease